MRLLTLRPHEGSEGDHNYFSEDPLTRAIKGHSMLLSFSLNDEQPACIVFTEGTLEVKVWVTFESISHNVINKMHLYNPPNSADITGDMTDALH